MLYKQKSNNWSKHFDFLLLDLICLQIAFLCAYQMRHGFVNPYQYPLYRNMALVLGTLDIVVLFVCDTLKNVLKRGYAKEFFATAKQGVVVILLSAMYLFLVQESELFSRIVLFLTLGSYTVLAYLARLCWKKVLYKTRNVVDKPALLIVTISNSIETAMKNVNAGYYGIYKIIGLVILDKDMVGQNIKGIPVVANEETVIEYACRGWVDEVFMACSHKYIARKNLVEQFVGMGIAVHENLFENKELIRNRQIIQHFGGFTVLTTTLNYASGKDLLYKRLLDIAGGLIGCLITGVLFLVLAPAIYIKSPGPIFFSQERVGKNGKRFKIYKFRSMYLNAEERKKELMEENVVKDGMMFKIPYDLRIIGCKKRADGTIKKGVGNYIRDWSLDEFPQFFNVLRGEMSIVGTRPPTLDEWEKYETHHRARLAIKPGITGMWQINGRSDITDFEKVVALDTQYINEWSIGLDFQIILKTLLVVLRRDGSM